jgi:bifunctional non-homologous end joining protein LigD
LAASPAYTNKITNCTPTGSREMQWVKPELMVQVRFVEWTAEGRLRHAAFVGVRPDKDAGEVQRE